MGMIKENNRRNSSINRLADYVLLNAYSLNSAGFYNGKAGLSLALFEVARLLHNEYLEEHAFELIQEALVASRNSSYSFENGLSGVGYVFRYLINNNFLEADFEDFFGEQEQAMRKAAFSDKFVSITTAYYFNEIDDLQFIIKESVSDLSLQFDLPLLSLPTRIKVNLFKQYETVLKVTASCIGQVDISELLYKYVRLYRAGWGISDFFLGYYMQQLTTLAVDDEIKSSTEQMINYSLANFRPEQLSLSRCIDWLYLLKKNKVYYQNEIIALESNLFVPDEKELEQMLVRMIPSTALMCGYENGISRWLLYLVFCNLSERGEDVSRFDYLFK